MRGCFLACVNQCLVPSLKRGDIVIVDNPPVRKVIQQAIEAASAKLRYLPPYSPDLGPFGMAIGKAKAHFRRPPSAQFLLRMRVAESFIPKSAGISCAMFKRGQNPLYSLDLNPH
jgi:transposase